LCSAVEASREVPEALLASCVPNLKRQKQQKEACEEDVVVVGSTAGSIDLHRQLIPIQLDFFICKDSKL
jgi:hypothetical protein